MAEIRRCDRSAPPSSFRHVSISGEVFDRCPKAWLHLQSDASSALDLWHAYQRGTMPFDGGLLDQHPRHLEAFRVLEEETAKIRAAKHRAAKRTEAPGGTPG